MIQKKWQLFASAGLFLTMSTLAFGKSWKQGRTSVSDFSFAEKQQLTGVSLSEFKNLENYGKHLGNLNATFPSEFDWRNQNGNNFVAPVKNQGRCGSCVAFATSSLFETQMNIATNSPTHPWSFSPQHLFACGGGACKTGWQTGYAVDHIISKGVPEEACFPYVSGALGEDKECRATCSDSKARLLKAEFRVKSPAVVGASIEDVKAALLNGPVASNMKVFEDFYNYKSGVYRHKSGKIVGGHAVLIVGWSNENQAWIVRNSWGTHWGMDGDFLIAWDDPGMLGGTFYGVNAPSNAKHVMLHGANDYAFNQQKISLSLSAQSFSIAAAVLEIRGSQGMLPSVTLNPEGQTTLDTTTLPDGVYTVQARARDNAGQEMVSQSHILYVRNGDVTGDIKIERIKAGMNVWDTIYPQFRVSSSPVPLQKIQYRLINSAGEEVLKKFAPHTANLVAIGVNPANLKVGPYTMIAEAIADNGKIVASDQTHFNVIEK